MPLCLCGCGKQTSNEKNKYVNGHQKNRLGKKCSEETRLKMRKSHLGKNGYWKNKERDVETKLKISNGNKGKIISEETRLKLSKNNGRGMLGKHHSLKTRLKLSSYTPWIKGKKVTPEARLKISLATIKYIENHKLSGKFVVPNQGKNEKNILDQIQNTSDIKFIRNDRDIFLKTGKFIDAYNQKYNLAIEVLEPHHFKVNGELSDNDQERELMISSRLGCMIYYIPEQEFLKNSEKEIQRYKNCIEVLSKC